MLQGTRPHGSQEAFSVSQEADYQDGNQGKHNGAGCRNGMCEQLHGSNYTEAEIQYMLAMERWMKAHKAKFPKFSDCLAVAVSLGYRRVADPTRLP